MTAATPTTGSQPTEDVARWFVAVGKTPAGPFNDSVLREKLASGEVTGEQRVFRKGLEGWERSKNIPEVQEMFASIEAERAAAAAAAASTPRWHVVVDKKPAGPFSDDQIEEMIVGGKLEEKSQLWRKGQDNWKPLAKIDELEPLRTRAFAEYAKNMPPPLLDEDDDVPPVPPTIIMDDPIPLSRERMVSLRAATPAASAPVVALKSPEAVRAAAPAAPAQVQPVEAVKPKVDKVEPKAYAIPALIEVKGLAIEVEPSKLAPVDRAFDSVRSLFAQHPNAVEALGKIQDSMRRDFLKGNAFGLDKSLEVLGTFVQVAKDRLPPGASQDATDAAWNDVLGVHRAAGLQVSTANHRNNVHDRVVNALGVRSRPDWAEAPRL